MMLLVQFTIHGTIGIFGMVMLGVLASGYPALGAFAPEDAATISFMGQLMSAGVMFLMGFVPGYVVSLLLKISRNVCVYQMRFRLKDLTLLKFLLRHSQKVCLVQILKLN